MPITIVQKCVHFEHPVKKGCIMKKYQILAAIFLSILSLSHIHAAQGQVEFNIRFSDRRIYYVDSSPIYVQITITNNSPSPYRFKLADDRAFSIDFDIRSMSNRRLPDSDMLVRKRTQMNHIFFREISIESMESFSFVEDLRDYVRFDQSGSFRLRAIVYPELIRAASIEEMESNYLNLTLRPPAIPGPDGIPLEMDIDTGAVLTRQPLSPDQVITYMITARQQSQWERYLLYIDLEAMLLQDAARRRQFLAENEEGRRRMIANFRLSLQTSVYDGDILVIPTSFEIMRTEYNSTEGTVIVLQRFRFPAFTDVRRYTYYLEKRDNIWVVVNYAVQGLGTERND